VTLVSDSTSDSSGNFDDKSSPMLVVLRYVGKVKVRADLVKQGIKYEEQILFSVEGDLYVPSASRGQGHR